MMQGRPIDPGLDSRIHNSQLSFFGTMHEPLFCAVFQTRFPDWIFGIPWFRIYHNIFYVRNREGPLQNLCTSFYVEVIFGYSIEQSMDCDETPT
jgi:hypothetical protein